MDKQDNYFYASGILSLSIFFIFIFSFIILLYNNTKNESFAMKKDTFVSISLDSVDVKTKPTKQKPKKEVSKPQVQKPAQAVESKPEVKKPVEKVDVNDLFSNVPTQKIIQKETKSSDSKRVSTTQQKVKSIETSDIKTVSENKSQTQEADAKEETKSASTANQVDEYLAKIQAIVYQHYHVPPNSQGHSVKIVIELNAFGMLLDFRVLSYSGNSALNEEADRIKERLKNVVFPKHPQNKSSKTIIILISKE